MKKVVLAVGGEVLRFSVVGLFWLVLVRFYAESRNGHQSHTLGAVMGPLIKMVRDFELSHVFCWPISEVCSWRFGDRIRLLVSCSGSCTNQ